MDKKKFLEDIVKIHSVSVATIDSDNKPTIRIIDMMYLENDCLYFLTARGKNFYQEITKGTFVVNSDKCISCKKCITVCPQRCIDYSTGKAYIKNKHCLRCGACKEVCPTNAIEQI